MNDGAPSVLVVDDEPSIQRVLKLSLAAAGYRVLVCGTGTDALSEIAHAIPDVILLDLGLPDMDGKDVIVSLRSWTIAPIIVLSARNGESERIAALDVGADDYVIKPFHMGELQARIRAALRYRQRRQAEQTTFSAGGLHIDFALGAIDQTYAQGIRPAAHARAACRSSGDAQAIARCRLGRRGNGYAICARLYRPAATEDRRRSQYAAFGAYRVRRGLSLDWRLMHRKPSSMRRFCSGLLEA